MIPMYDEGGDVQKRHSSSPGTPGFTGAIGDALSALRDYLISSPARQVGADRQAHIEHEAGLDDTPPAQPVQEHADGGEVDYVGNALGRMGYAPSTAATSAAEPPPPDQDSSLVGMKDFLQKHLGDLAARAGTSFARQFYGLDKNGHLVLGGRAWTSDQGGTPMGLLDNITAIPHHLVGLYNLANKLGAHMTGLPSEVTDQATPTLSSPKFSDEAADRAQTLKARADAALNFPEAHTLGQHIADNADVVTPIPGLQGEGAASHLAGLLGASSLRNLPRTTAEFAAINGGLDTLIDRMAEHHAGGGEVGIAERLAKLMEQYSESGSRDAEIMKDFQQNPIHPVAKHQVQAGVGLSHPEFNALIGAEDQPVHSENISKLLDQPTAAPSPAPALVAPQVANANTGTGGISRRGLLGILGALGAGAGKDLANLGDRMESRAAESAVPGIDHIKAEAFGHSDEPNWHFLDKYMPHYPDAAPHYQAFKDAFHNPSTTEDEMTQRALSFEDALNNSGG